LGIQFLRHVVRTRLLVHLIDVSEGSLRDPVKDFDVIMSELASYSDELVQKPMLVVANKIDAAQDPARLDAVKAVASERGMPFYSISAVTGQGVLDLVRAMAERALAPEHQPA
jgi:GTP-binding protein